MARFAVLVLLIVAMAAPLSACGRKNAPEPPPDATWTKPYPRR